MSDYLPYIFPRPISLLHEYRQQECPCYTVAGTSLSETRVAQRTLTGDPCVKKRLAHPINTDPEEGQLIPGHKPAKGRHFFVMRPTEGRPKKKRGKVVARKGGQQGRRIVGTEITTRRL